MAFNPLSAVFKPSNGGDMIKCQVIASKIKFEYYTSNMYLSKVIIIKKTCYSEDVFSGNCGSVLIDLSLYFVGYENDLIIYF